MYKDILRSIAGIEVFPVISLIVFVTFFTAVLVWAGRMSRGQVDRLSRLPLDDHISAETGAAATVALTGPASAALSEARR